MKKLAVLLCASLLACGMPAVAFGEPLDEVSSDIEVCALGDDLGGTGSRVGDDFVYDCSKADLSWNGVTAGTITGMKMVVKDAGKPGNEGHLYTTAPHEASAPQPYAVDASKTVLSATAFTVGFRHDTTPLVTLKDGGTMEYTYKASDELIENLANENEIKPSDIKLFVYEKDTNGSIQKLVSNASAASPVQVSTSDLRSGTFVMALACDSSLLSKAEAQPKPKPKPSSSSETFVGIDPVEIPVVAAGEDESDLSPKTGQALPSGTAPAALLVAAVLGGGVVIAVRRRSMR